MNVLIVMQDGVFARMLALEFADRGMTPVVASPREDMEPLFATAHLAFIDAEILKERELPPFSFETVILGYPETLAKVPTSRLTKYYTVARPFLIEDFFETFFESESSRALSFHIPKKKSPAEFLALDKENRTVYFKGEKVELTGREFALLDLLYENRGVPVSRAEAADLVFHDTENTTNVVDVYVNYLRQKLDHPFGVRLITTVRGKGYMIEENP